MKRTFLVFLALCGLLSFAGAQTTIDKPAATIKLSKQEIISQRQLKTDVEKLEKVIGSKLDSAKIRQILDARINSMLFLQYCEREKILVSDSEVNASLAKLKANLGAKATDADLETALRSEGVFVEPKVYARQRLLFQAYVQTKKAAELKAVSGEPTADEVLKAYDLAKASLLVPDTMRISILYVDTRGKSDADIKKAKDTINGLASTLKINPGKFDELSLRAGEAAGYKSISSMYLEKSAQNRNAFGPELFDAVFKLKPGDISPVIESATGYRIIRANEFSAQKQLSLSDTVPGNPNVTIQQYIAYQVAMSKQSDLLDKLESDLITQLRKDATIKIYEENLVF